jgi:hypothetical protein
MNEEISKNWADLILLWCYIITGLLDSSATVIWGSFVSMQTGKLVASYPTCLMHGRKYDISWTWTHSPE